MRRCGDGRPRRGEGCENDDVGVELLEINRPRDSTGLKEHQLPKRRDVIFGLSAALAGTPLTALASPKKGLCQPCNGNGNCISGNCQGVCMPTSNPCAGRGKKQFFFCKTGVPVCCKASGKKCRAI